MIGAKKRVRYIDMVKGFAIVSIVVSHAFDYGLDKFFSGNFMTRNYINLILGVFFITSGYFYSKGKRSVGDNIKSRIKSILVPYWIYLILISALDFLRIAIFEKKWEPAAFYRGLIACVWGSTRIPFELPFLGITRWKDGTIAVLVSRTAPFWYLPALFMGSIFLFVIIEKLYDRENKRTFVNVILAAFPLMLISLIDKNLFETWQLPWAVCAGAVAALLLVCGYFIKETAVLNVDESSFSRKLMTAGLLTALIYIACGSYSGSFVYTDFGEGPAFGNIILYLLGSIALFLFLAVLFKLLEDKAAIVTNLLSRLGEMSLYIFVFHYLIIRYLDNIFYAVMPSAAASLQNHYAARIVICIAYVFLSVLISYGIGAGIIRIKKAF